MANKFKVVPDGWMKVKAYAMLFLIMGTFAGVLIFHLFRISVIEHDRYTKMANDYHFGTITLSADRGAIYDANGTPLASSASVYNVYIDSVLYKQEIDELVEKNEKLENQNKKKKKKSGDIEGYVDIQAIQTNLINYLSGKLEIETSVITEAMQKDSRYTVLKTRVEKPDADEILEVVDSMGFGCIATEQSTMRYYTQNEIAASVIGFTNAEGHGQYGLESYYDSYLSGTDGREISAKDANGNVMPYNKAETYEAVNGDSLYLTIDTTLQYYLEENISAMCNEFNVQDGAAGIIMNAKTGAIYAMASYPGFDLNKPSEIFDEATARTLAGLSGKEYDDAYSEAREKQWRNKCVSEPYIPGSVFKMITGAAAIEEGTVDVDTFGYNCIGYIDVLGAIIKCSHTAGQGYLTFQDAMTKSCNPAFVQIGLDLGVDKFSDYFSSFGLANTTGIDLPAESGSLFYSREDMGQVELGSGAFGQTNKVTLIQMVTACAATINGGYLLTPYVVDEVLDSSGNTIIDNKRTVKRQVISTETSDTMKQVLQTAVDQTPDANAYIAGYKIGGKTGTAQKNDEYTDENMRYVASYCCFAPADDPEIIMLIMADEPDNSIAYYGAQVVAPTAKNIMGDILPYLGFYPEYSGSDYSSLTENVPDLNGLMVDQAEDALSELNISYIVSGSGDVVTGQSPQGGISMLTGGTVIIYTSDMIDPETVTVPDLTGKTVSAAKTELYEIGLNLYISRPGDDETNLIVTSQSIEAGTEVDKGSVIMLSIGLSDGDGEYDDYYEDEEVQHEVYLD